MNNKYVSLHNHTVYSLLDGYCRIPDLVMKAKELGMSAIAITDHNHLLGIPEMQVECKKQDIKPLLGCCLPDQLIYTLEGLKPIKDVQVGDYVLTHTGQYKKVTRHWSRHYNGTLFGIKGWCTNTVWLTEEHPVHTRKVYIDDTLQGQFKKTSELTWTRADSIQQERILKNTSHSKRHAWKYWLTFPKHNINFNLVAINVIDYLPSDTYEVSDGVIKKKDVPSYHNVKHRIPNYITLTTDLMRLFGLFIAEGSYGKTNTSTLAQINFSFNRKEKYLHNIVKQAIESIFQIPVIIDYRTGIKYNCTEVYACSRTLAELFFNLFGEYAQSKKIPTWFLQLHPDLQYAFLDGVCLGDGKFNSRNVCLKLANKNLIYQIRAMLVNLGMLSSVSEVKQQVNGKTCIAWALQFTVDPTLGKYYFEDERYVYTPVRLNLQKQEYNGDVYNFTVEDDNSYVTDFTLHNCEGYFSPDCSQLTAPVEERHKKAEEAAIASGEYTDKVIRNLKGEEKKKFYKKYSYDTTGYHILFIAKDQQGWNNLVKLQSEAARLGTFNGRYHCDYNLLEKYHEGLICTTACIASYSSRKICSGEEKAAVKYLDFMKDLFGVNFFLEIQPLTDEDDRQIQTNLFYLNYAVDNDLPVIATNDVHWIRREDYTAHEILTCIGTGYKMSDENRMAYDPVFWLRSEEEMLEAFNLQMNVAIDKGYLLEEEALIYQETYIGAVDNTGYITDLIDPNIRLGSDKLLFPSVELNNQTPEEALIEKAQAGLQTYLKQYPNLDKEIYEKRLQHELVVINKKGFAPYFLTIEEMISWCYDNDIAVGPGRGSAAGSLVLFCLGITKCIDPIRDELIFERFLSEDRVAMPDVDTDYSWLNRDKVIQHLEDMYGRQCVAHIGTVTALKVKSAIKDVCRVLGIDFKTSLQISKVIDSLETDPNLSFKMIDSWKEEAPDKWQQIQELEEKYPEVFKYARLFEGIPRQMGVHASGILVMPMSVSDMFPVRYIDGTAVTLWTGTQVDEYMALKLDVLGLKSMDIIQETLTTVGLNLKDFYNNFNREDPNIYKMINNKKTEAVFQIESDLMKGLVEEIKPTSFKDLAAMIAIG